MSFEDILFRSQYAALLLANLFTALFAVQTYHRTGRKDRLLFLVAIAAVLGFVSNALSFASSYKRQSPEQAYLFWVFICLISIVDAALWAWTTCQLVKRVTWVPLPAADNSLRV